MRMHTGRTGNIEVVQDCELTELYGPRLKHQGDDKQNQD